MLCWEQHERDGSWHAWVYRVQSTEDPVRHRHHVVSVRANEVTRLENPGAYEAVPRRTFGSDGRIRPWTPAAVNMVRGGQGSGSQPQRMTFSGATEPCPILGAERERRAAVRHGQKRSTCPARLL